LVKQTKRRQGKTEPIIVDGIHEPIIDQELWEKVQSVNDIQKKTFTSNRNFNGNFFLSGILKCPKCGAGTVMSKSKKKNSDDYHLYYMCQSFHSKGKSVCKANLIKKEMVEEKVFKEISFLVNNEEVLNALICELSKDNIVAKEAYQEELSTYKQQLKKVIERRSKLDDDYFEGIIESGTYNRLMIEIEKKIKELEKCIKKSENEIVSNEAKVGKDLIFNTLKNFDQFFSLVSDEEKKLLVRSLIKEIKMEDNRKDVKEITFWFSSNSSLPSSKVSRTVP
jgi:site-specific DNA recombinase